MKKEKLGSKEEQGQEAQRDQQSSGYLLRGDHSRQEREKEAKEY